MVKKDVKEYNAYLQDTSCVWTVEWFFLFYGVAGLGCRASARPRDQHQATRVDCSVGSILRVQSSVHILNFHLGCMEKVKLNTNIRDGDG